jgi:prepilin-type N-terminal cleavage/methylation domain-containing protein
MPLRLSVRRAFTLPELIVSVAIAGIVAGAITTTLVRQQRFFGASAEVLDVRSQLRDAADVLASDLRGAAVASFGLPVMTDSAIELYTTIGTSVACAAPSGAVVALAPSVLANGNTLTSLVVTPDTGDLAAIYSIPANNIDSARWETRRISAFATKSLAATCPASTGFTTVADAVAGATGYQATLASSPGPDVHKGAPVRFLRRARYSIYKSSDGKWYLGYRRCSAGVPSSCATVQPLSGPYRPYGSRGAESGLSFRYYDVSGAEVPAGSNGVSVARIDVVIRGESSRRIALAGDAQRSFRDSVVVSVSPRNRLR